MQLNNIALEQAHTLPALIWDMALATEPEPLCQRLRKSPSRCSRARTDGIELPSLMPFNTSALYWRCFRPGANTAR